MTGLPYRDLITGHKPHKPLMGSLKSHAGRNNRGVITVRHQGGGVKQLYRFVDFKQDKMNIPGKVLTIERDPYRNAFIALVQYRDGEKRYVLAVKDLKVGDEIVTKEIAEARPGNRMRLSQIPLGTFISNIELKAGAGGKLARSAGAYAEVVAQEGPLTTLKLGSKEVRQISSNGFATVGQMSNPDYILLQLGKAGRSRWLGIRPTVRGSVMNPVDHPYGGGEGKQPRGTRRPKTRWGKITGGRKTRRPKKWSNKLILTRRPKVR
jgi:large subunit ribosomal protein L2